jgi:hypothetical protein
MKVVLKMTLLLVLLLCRTSASGDNTPTLEAGVETLERTDQVSIPAIDPNEQTSLHLVSEAGDPIGQGRTIDCDLVNGSVYHFGTRLTFGNTATGEGFRLFFTGPLGAPLHVGRYDGVDTGETNNLLPQFGLLGAGLARLPFTGWFEVKKVSYNNVSEFDALWVVFEIHAQGSAAAFRGELKYHAEADIPSVNQYPVAYVPLLDNLYITDTATLHGYVEDDNQPGPLTTKWSLGSGPGTVTFADDSALETTARFSAPGLYVLWLTANDGVLESTATQQISVVETADETSLRLASETGDPVGAGESLTITRLEAGVFSSVSSEGGVSIFFDRSGDYDRNWSVSLAPPAGETLHPGVYADAVCGVGYSSIADRPGLSVNRPYNHDQGVHGSFTIRQIEFNADGVLKSLRATFTQYASATDTAALTGEVRYHAHPELPLADFAPVVGAGPDVAIDFPAPAKLNGYAADDSLLGKALPVEWTKVSGPGDVTFGDTHAAVTTVNFFTPGTYVLRLTASDGALTVSDDVTVVQSALETSLRVQVQNNQGAVIHLYTQADGTFSAGIPNAGAAEGTLWFEFESPDHATRWVGQFSPASGEEVHPRFYEHVNSAYAGSTPRGYLTVSVNDTEDFSTTSFYPTDLASTVEVKSLTLGSNGIIESCWITFTIKKDDSTLTGEFRYHTNLNAAPHIAMPDDVKIFGQTLQLDALVTDDHLPTGSNVSVKWSAEAGASGALFTAPEEISTAVHLSEPGSYRLRLTASDGEQTSYAETIVRSAPAKGRWSGLVFLAEQSGFLQISRTAAGTFSGSLRIGPRRIALRGILRGEATVVPIALGNQTIELTLTPGESGELLAKFDPDEEDFTYTLEYDDPYPYAAEDFARRVAFTFLDPDESLLGVFPHIWGKVTVHKNGGVSIVVRLTDGSRAGGTGVLTKNLDFTVLLPIGHTRSWLGFTASYNRFDDYWFGVAHWSRQRPATRRASETSLSIVGGAAAILAPDREPLTGIYASVRARLTLTVPGQPVVKLPMVIRPGGTVVGFGGGNSWSSLTFAPGGVFSGYALHPVTHQLMNFSGIIYESISMGFGFVLCNGVPGDARLEQAPLNADISAPSR